MDHTHFTQNRLYFHGVYLPYSCFLYEQITLNIAITKLFEIKQQNRILLNYFFLTSKVLGQSSKTITPKPNRSDTIEWTILQNLLKEYLFRTGLVTGIKFASLQHLIIFW